jgi:D-alanine-D-alanine ligase-like ATP-grasp enzyme
VTPADLGHADALRLCPVIVQAYGAIDLILTPDGRHVFLEINPNGQSCGSRTRPGCRSARPW